ncbi:MAG TPA: class I SAM-dependent methyltransferase [Chthoniobacterales bacterium]|nr:class I SAM-dependent methyltransferase [Chthoniobacterales bacterium]
MENPRDETTAHELACARVASRFPRGWLRSYVKSKLRRDPIFPAACELLRGSDQPILDVGCGVGLLAFYLRERGCTQSITGLDVDARKIRRANHAAAGRYRDVSFHEHDVREPIAEFRGNIALFDVLHYLPLAEQSALLSKLAQSIAPAGLLIIRDCPRDGSFRFWMTWLAEKFAQTISWNWNAPLHFPTRARINAAFSETEFTREIHPLWGSSPFNNRIFIFRGTGVSPVGRAGFQPAAVQDRRQDACGPHSQDGCAT